MRLRYYLSLLIALLIVACSGYLSGQQPRTAPTTAATPAAGTIETYAGNGFGAGALFSGGYSGDGGPATSAELNTPWGMTFDAAGNLYIADEGNNRIRKVTPGTGTITTVAGNGSEGLCTETTPQTYCGNGGPATSATITLPEAVVFDSAGNFYIAEAGLIRKVAASTGTISTYAGDINCVNDVCTPTSGYSGDGGPATSAQLDEPFGLAVDASNNLYIADYGAKVVRMVSSSTGIITTVAGGGSGCAQQTDTAGDGCPATQAQFTGPQAIVLDKAGNLYVVDSQPIESDSSVIRKVDAKSGIITLFAGDGTPNVNCSQETDSFGDGCPALNASLVPVNGLAFDAAGNLYLSDPNIVQVINASTTVITLVAGNGLAGFTGTGGPAQNAELNDPAGVALDASGNVYFADAANNVIREVIGNTTPVAPAPTFSPAAGTYTSEQMISLSDSLSGAAIYYTTDGSTPTTSSTEYTGAITVSQTTTINAIAAASGYSNSAVAAAMYTIQQPAATPMFTPPGGTYTSAQTVTISDSTTGVTIYYTTDGSTPTTSSTKYTAPITVAQTATISAIAAASGYANSAEATATYTIQTQQQQAAIPTFSPTPGTYTSPQAVTISDATSGATIYYTTDGSMPTTSSAKYSAPITVSTTETINALAAASGYTNSNVATGIYTINTTPPPVVPNPTFSPAAGTYTSTQAVIVSDTLSGATIYYTTDGSTPTTSSTQYTGPISVSSTETISAIAAASGYTNSAVVTATYTIPASFTVSASPTSLTVTAGSSGTSTITITPQNGFSAAVSFACTGLPSGATCSFSPSTVTPSGGTATTTLTIATTTASASLRPSRNPLLPGGATLALALCFFGFRRRRTLQEFLMLTVCVFGIGWLSGCGGGSGSSGGGGESSTRNVVVTATSGSSSQTATLTLTINP